MFTTWFIIEFEMLAISDLVGGFNMFQTQLKNMKVTWDSDSQYMDKLDIFESTNR